ncbi:hypothetical protein BH24ACT15_BH24ACT15_15060 [soil metagenome]|jgi:uncharacterized protein YutE (UPF0331/DUF86 family)
MTPRRIDPEVVQVKLRHIARLRRNLSDLGDLTVSRLTDEPVSRHASEWILTQIAQLAASAASYLVVRASERVPTTHRESFRLLASEKVIDDELAERLVNLAGMRNLLVHRYDDIDLDQLAQGLSRLPADTDSFVEQVTAHLQDLLGED